MKRIIAFFIFILVHTQATANPILCGPIEDKKTIEHSVKWYRASAEQKATYRQVFSMGTQYVQQWIATHKPKKHTWGVILDIDETVLDNSWYYETCLDSVHRETDFERFIVLPQKSSALPGAVEFTRFVRQAGGYVSLVSNRDGSWKSELGNSLDATIANLKKEHIEFDQVILSNTAQSKKPYDKNKRFNAIILGQYNDSEMVKTNALPAHPVIAWFGDNIQDFPDFKQKSMHQKDKNDKDFDKFAQGYFIFPNPVYGSWVVNRLG